MSTQKPLSAVFVEPGRVELRREDDAPFGPGMVRVRIESCGLCTMEQRLWLGSQTDYPIAAGHEAAGVVMECHPEGTHGVSVGDRVALALIDRCMQCTHCRRGDTQLCVGKFVGRQPGRFRRIGGLSEQVTVPAWKLFVMPGDMSTDEIALAEPLACVVHSISRADPQLGDDVLVIGGGVMGQLHVLVARLRGARVFLSDPRPDKRELALAHGAAFVFDEVDVVDGVRAHTGGRGADIVYVTFGNADTAALASALAARGGRIMYFGGFSSEVGTDITPSRIHRDEVVVDGARSQTLTDWSRATRLLGNRLIDASRLITASYPLAEVEIALQHAVDPASFRIMVHPGRG